MYGPIPSVMFKRKMAVKDMIKYDQNNLPMFANGEDVFSSMEKKVGVNVKKR